MRQRTLPVNANTPTPIRAFKPGRVSPLPIALVTRSTRPPPLPAGDETSETAYRTGTENQPHASNL